MNVIITLQEECPNYPSRKSFKKNDLITHKKTLQKNVLITLKMIVLITLQDEYANYPKR
jgi:hypothetical protein